MTISREDRDFLWDHFKFNADQRIKAFNFFVILSGFANGGLFTAYEKNFSAFILIAIGILIIILSTVFFIIDHRSRYLTQLAIPGLIAYEASTLSSLSDNIKIFTRDNQANWKFLKYKTAFITLHIVQGVMGLGTVLYGLDKQFF